jgi:hypothetical protein
MSTAKFEKLIDLIINEDNERAEQLFHEIVVEKSRDIYESLISEDEVTGMMDEISDEMGDNEIGMEGMMEDDDEFIDDEEIEGDYDTEDGDVEFDDEVELDDEDGEGYEEEELEDRVVDLEDKLDQLMAEFEQEFGGGEEEGEEEFGSEEGEEEFGSEEESDVMEAVELKKVSVTHTDGADGSSKKSTVDANSGQKGMASKPVNFSGSSESVPTSPKKPTNYGAKGETEVKGAGSFKNKVGGDASNGSGKGESAPKPTKTQASGTNERSAVPESRRTTKRRI